MLLVRELWLATSSTALRSAHDQLLPDRREWPNGHCLVLRRQGRGTQVRSDKEILSLLTKRARVLHLGTSNYCWFTDPSRALCLKLAGDPAAGWPLIGMCDSARCPQATHHPRHRPVWAEHAEQTGKLLAGLGPTRKTERKRLEAEYDRAVRVLARIDETAAAGEPG